MTTPGSMFEIPEEDMQKLTTMLDEMIADMEERADLFLKQVDKERDSLNAVEEQLTPEEVERRDLATGLSQMSADFALVPLRFLKTNRDALLRNGPDMIYLVVDMVMNSQEGVQAAVQEYQAQVNAALGRADEQEGDNS